MIRPAGIPDKLRSEFDSPDMVLTVAAIVEDGTTGIESFLERTSAVLSHCYRFYELLIVDNGSSKEMADKLKVLQKKFAGVRLLRLPRFYRFEVALAAAIENSVGDYIVLINPCYDPVELITELVRRAQAGHDVVIAEPRTQRISAARKLLRTVTTTLASRILGYKFEPHYSYYWVLSRRVANSLSRISDQKRYLNHLSALTGFAQSIYVYDIPEGQGPRGQELRLATEMRIVADIIFSDTAVPLRFTTMLGLLASLLSLLYLAYVLVVSLIKAKVAEGWITTSVLNSSMFFMLFLILTILSEYVYRILVESRGRPLYFIEDEVSDTPPTRDDDLNVVA